MEMVGNLQLEYLDEDISTLVNQRTENDSDPA